MISKLVYVIILNYNGCNDTIKCIYSIKKSNYHKIKILVVDNGSQDDSVNKIKKEFPDLDIIQTGQNMGFAGGNNVGIQRALQEGAEYICILNNDVIVSENMIDVLVQSLCQNDRRIVGPATMIWDSETVHSTGMIINFFTGTARILNLWKDYSLIEKSAIYCDYLEGTCLMCTKKCIEEVGNIPEVYFLYYEETEWCCTAKKKGYEVVCIPSARLWHRGSASVDKITGLKLYFEDRNRVLFERRNAPFTSKIFFYIYFTIQMVYRLLSGQRDWRALRSVMDGFSNRIDWTIYDVDAD